MRIMFCKSRRNLCPTCQLRAARPVCKLWHDYWRLGNDTGQAENASPEGLRWGLHFPISHLTCSQACALHLRAALVGFPGEAPESGLITRQILWLRQVQPFPDGKRRQMTNYRKPQRQLPKFSVSRRPTKPPWLPWMSGPHVYTAHISPDHDGTGADYLAPLPPKTQQQRGWKHQP